MKKINFLYVALCLSIQTLEAQENERTVDLQFDWPDGLALSVERSFTRKTNIGPKNENILSKSEFTWTLKKSGDENRIFFSGFKETSPESGPKTKDPVVQLEYISRKVEPILPTIVVDANAQPIRLDQLDEVVSHVENKVKSIDGLDDQMFQQFVSILLNEQAFQVRALEDWNRMIQVWSGMKGAEVGGSSQTSSVTGNAVGKPIENLFIYRVDEGPTSDTITLTVIQKPKKNQVKLILDKMLGGDVYKELQLPKDSELFFENRFTTICSPSTLIPISYVKKKTWGAYEGNNRIFHGRSDTWSYTFKTINKN